MEGDCGDKIWGLGLYEERCVSITSELILAFRYEIPSQSTGYNKSMIHIIWISGYNWTFTVLVITSYTAKRLGWTGVVDGSRLARARARTHKHTHTHTHTHIYIYIYTYNTHTHMRTYISTHIHTYIYTTHTHTYVHIYVRIYKE